MLRTTLTASFLLLMLGAAFAQERNCATMQVLERQLQEKPALRHHFDSLNTAHTQQAQQSPLGSPTKAHSYPAIPGFEPTGDPAVDARNFAAAKKALYAADPEQYLRLTSKVFPADHQKTPRK